jgi:multisubunit Na+/H+ antiporter MnhC subunit
VNVAIGLLIVSLATNVLGYFVPALNLDGVATFSVSDIIAEAIILTAIVVIADRAARRDLN